MASDNRYYSQQDPNAPYTYAQYPPYDPAQYPPNSARPMRNGASHPHPAQAQPPPPQPQPPPPPQYTTHPPPPSGYPQQAYPPPSYGVPHTQTPPQWTPESWQHYQQSFPPPNQPMQQESPYGARPEAQPPQPAASETRAPSAGSSRPDNRRTEERAERPLEAAPQPSLVKVKSRKSSLRHPRHYLRLLRS